MRALGVAATVVLTLVTGTIGANVAAADETPSRQDVQDARVAVRDTADTVASVQASLVVANQRLQESAVAAAQAAEAFNGARWRAAEARKAAATARDRAGVAAADLERQRQMYGDALLTSYELSPGLSALSAIVHSDGIETVLQHTATLETAEDALDGTYDEFQAAATLADVATDRAEDAETAATDAQQDARDARDAARSAADAAASQAQTIAVEKEALIGRLAELEQVSVQIAERRQAGLEQEAAEASAAAAQAEADQQAADAAAEQAAAEAESAEESAADPTPSADPAPTDDPAPDPEPTTPAPAPTTPAPTTPAPATPAPAAPAPASGASAAIAFARAQIGEPYRWAAAGPSAWDCSGLTMGAWAAGGRYLPHYSVAQYEQSTPISAGQLRPGDLVFWGSSSSPGSIYHVALYVGNGMIIHAPRTGVPVQEVSMYYWITPNFYARP